MPTPVSPTQESVEVEGTRKFRLDFAAARPPDWALIAPLEAWRQLLFRLGLTGLDPDRYGGLAYGNVSRRVGDRRLVISGTGTGALERLSERHYCVVKDFDVAANWLSAEGPVEPSSEALTHAAAYQARKSIRCVLHVHSPEIWRAATRLGIPLTNPGIAYGTPEMAVAVEALLAVPTNRVIAMGGHQDGLIAAGETAETAAFALIGRLAAACRRDG